MTCPGTHTDEDRGLCSPHRKRGKERTGLLFCRAVWGGWMMEWIINIRCCPLLVQPPTVNAEPHSAVSLIEAWAISVGNLQHNGKYPQWEIKYWCYRTIRGTSGVAHLPPLFLGIFICSQAGMNSCKSPGTQLWKYRLLRCLRLALGGDPCIHWFNRLLFIMEWTFHGSLWFKSVSSRTLWTCFSIYKMRPSSSSSIIVIITIMIIIITMKVPFSLGFSEN